MMDGFQLGSSTDAKRDRFPDGTEGEEAWRKKIHIEVSVALIRTVPPTCTAAGW